MRMVPLVRREVLMMMATPADGVVVVQMVLVGDSVKSCLGALGGGLGVDSCLLEADNG